MSVEPLKIGQKFIKLDEKVKNKDIQKEITEKKYYYDKSQNGNVNINDLFTILLNKIDSLGSTRNIYGEVNNNMEAVEVDIKKDIFIEKTDLSKIESEKIEDKPETLTEEELTYRNSLCVALGYTPDIPYKIQKINN